MFYFKFTFKTMMNFYFENSACNLRPSIRLVFSFSSVFFFFIILLNKKDSFKKHKIIKPK